MRRNLIINIGILTLLLLIGTSPLLLLAQTYNLGWSGTELVPESTFLNSANWTTNVPDASLGDKSIVTANGDTLVLNWTFGTGNRGKWAQCYINFSQAISLANYDLFGFDLKGMPNNGNVGFELKFEDGIHQAVVSWDGLAGLYRWADNISAAKKQFSNSAIMDWSNVKVISFAVYAEASAQYVNTDQGSVRIYNLVGTSMANWERASSREFINPNDFTTIKQNAIDAIINRQTSTGLLTTWTQDNSSWLYGQGLALKALSCEGNWSLGAPDNASAIAAEKLALFLATNQQPEGYWPRAWNSGTGAISVLRESDGTVWMGDFPWIITGLQAYYKKSGDQRVNSAIQKGLVFLKNFISTDGKFLTVNPESGITSEVASCEAYAAAILCLEESGETVLADKLYNYINTFAWDTELRCWREATYSDRIVLFANTWMSYYNFQKGETQKGLDALSLAGNVLYTHGNGEMVGLDGIVPLAIWIEGTLSYIAEGGPGSNSLFEEVQKQIKPDGMVPHYNENLGGMGGIWAVDWHSLDGTSWLYFTTAGKSPFDVLEGFPVGINQFPAEKNGKDFNVFVIRGNELIIKPLITVNKEFNIRIIQSDGRLISSDKVLVSSEGITMSLPGNSHLNGVVLVQLIGHDKSECYPVVVY